MSAPRPSPDSAELLALADAYEAGTAKAVASGYEEYGPKFQHERNLIVEALRAQARSCPIPDLISRHALVSSLRKERDDYFWENFAQDPATGAYEASNAKEEYLAELDERIEAIEQFPAFELGPIATVVNNNQPGWINLIETAPNVTLDVGTKLYTAPQPTGVAQKPVWQPIETAPRDGTQVILWAEAWDMTWGIQIGCFEEGEWRTSEGAVGDNDEDFDPDADVGEDEEFDEDANLGPTHWQPLPAPPSNQGASK